MSSTQASAERHAPTDVSAASLVKETALGCAFWLAFLLILEPGNAVRAARAGVSLGWAQEALRIAVASLLAAPSAPPLLWLTRRFPIEGRRAAGHVGLHLLVIGLLALSLIVIARVLGSWLRPDLNRVSLGDQIAANVFLMMFAMAGFVACAHAVRFLREQSRTPLASSEGDRLSRIPVKSRGRTLLLDTEGIDWIEAQGNYVALHAGAAVHLIRGTLATLEGRLPQDFVRIHRGTIVNLARLSQIRSLQNGDATIRLADGTELRMSRGRRDRLKARLPG